MDETNDRGRADSDPLAELIRAAGRRSEPPREHCDQVFAAAHRVWQAKVRSRRNGRWLGLAASVALLAVIGVLVNELRTIEPDPAAGSVASLALARGTVERISPGSGTWTRISASGLTLEVDTRVRTEDDGRAAFDLARGGSLRIAGNTEIAVGVESIRLTAGALYFDSAGRSPSMPLIIETPMGRVLDIGTQFEVSVGAESLRIRVREGEIELLDSAASSEVLGERGEEIELFDTGRLVRRPIAPDDPSWAWAESLTSVPDVASRSILTYLHWIARETGKRLEFESESVELAAQFASFGGDPSGLSPLGLLSSIAATSDFDYRLTEDGAIFIERQ